jgi:hypothetical protein
MTMEQHSFDPSDWEVGQFYSWETLANRLSGQQNFMPKKAGRITCARLNAEINPEAPSVIVVGTKRGNMRNAEEYCNNPFPLPVFIKEATSSYRYCGRFSYVRHSTDPEELQNHDRSGRPQLSRVIYMEPYLEAGTKEITISPSNFAAAFEHFGRSVKRETPNEPFLDFTQGLAHRWEGYKAGLRGKAVDLLGASRWTRREIGSGTVLERTIRAIEIKDWDGMRNNLVEWERKGRAPGSESHHRMLAAREDRNTWRDVESILFRMFRDKRPPQDSFEELIGAFGSRYDLISYLFFLRDGAEYLPVRPSRFSQAFDILGVPLTMVQRCRWENYQAFLARMREVHRHLLLLDLPTAPTLLDAHSFCWMLVSLSAPDEQELIPTSSPMVPIAGQHPTTTAHDTTTLRDLDRNQKKQRQIGATAQWMVLRFEKKRLDEAGRSDLAERVVDVSDNLTLGYDIESYNADGSPKRIEVKVAASRGEDFRFFLSRNELSKSHEIEGYAFALVTKMDTSEPVIHEFLGAQLPPESLFPVSYEVRLRKGNP